jgi:hypothetical protein
MAESCSKTTSTTPRTMPRSTRKGAAPSGVCRLDGLTRLGWCTSGMGNWKLISRTTRVALTSGSAPPSRVGSGVRTAWKSTCAAASTCSCAHAVAGGAPPQQRAQLGAAWLRRQHLGGVAHAGQVVEVHALEGLVQEDARGCAARQWSSGALELAPLACLRGLAWGNRHRQRGGVVDVGLGLLVGGALREGPGAPPREA